MVGITSIVSRDVVTEEARPFWQGTLEGKLLLPFCCQCASTFWYPRAFCPRCGSAAVEWATATGQGTVYSYTAVYRDDDGRTSATPRILAYVELEEGPILLTNIVNHGGVDSLMIGQSVRVHFEGSTENYRLPVFEPLPR